MNVILDLAVVGIFALTVIVGYKRGFIKSLMGLASGVLALIIAFLLSPTLAKVVDEHWIGPSVVKAVQDEIVAMDPTEGNLWDFLEQSPQELKEFLDSIGIDPSQLDSYLPEQSTQQDAASELTAISEALAAPLSNVISTVISFIVIYLASLIALKLITAMLDGLFKLPVLRIPNKLLGAVVGVITGAITSLVVCSVIGMVLPYLSGGENTMFSNVTADKTLLFRFFCGFEGVASLLGTIIK